MKDQRKTDIRVGITVIISLLLLVWIFGWAKNYKLNAEEKYINIVFETVAGLEKGDPVTVNGVRKGFVEEITIQGNNAVVKAILDNDVQLKKDAKFAVTMLDLMGGKKIEIRPGVDPSALDYSKVQQGEFYADIPSVMAMIGSIQDDLINIVKEVQVTLGSINKVMSDEQFNQKLKSSLDNLAQISSKLNTMIDENRASIKVLTKNSAELSGEAAALLKENKEKFTVTLDEMQSVVKKTNNLIDQITSLTEETKQKKNNVGKLLYDEQILDDLKTSLKQVKELTNILNEQLKGKGINVDANIDLF